MANFNYYLNRQGSIGRQGIKGDKGEAGYSPYIDIKSNTPTEFIMTIHNETESFDTPNLIPTAIGEKVTEMDAVLTTHTEDIANLKLDITAIKSKNTAQDSDIAALKTRVGGTEESIEDLNHKYTVLGSEVSDLSFKKQNKLVQGDNITLTDNADGTTTISASGGGGGGGSDVPIATTQVAGKVKPDGTTITVTDDGTISAVGGGGSEPPVNMVTTDTTQTISGYKTITNNLSVKGSVNSRGIGIECINNSPVTQGLTIHNEDMVGRVFNISVNDAGQANISGTTLNIGDVSLNTYVSGRNINMTTGDAGNLVVNTNNPIKVHNKTANTDDIVLVQGNIKAGDNVSLTKDTTTGDITISSTGGGSPEPPANMVTTDTDQDITGIKTFKGNASNNDPSIIIGGRRIGLDDAIGGKIATHGSGSLEISTGAKGDLGLALIMTRSASNTPSYFEFTSNSSDIIPAIKLGKTNYQGTIKYDTSAYPNGFLFETQNALSGYPYSSFKIGDDTLAFKKTDGTVVDLLAGGSSEPPANMVTTDTDQFITGTKSFYGSINLKGSETDNYYSMITNTGGSIKLQPQYGDPAGLNIQTNDVQFIDSQGISHSLLSQSKLNADEYYYKAGDVFTTESYAVVPAIFSNSKTQILMSIPMPKSMKNVSNISVTKCVLSPRVPSGGYLPSAHFDFLADAGTTITAYKPFDNLLTLRIDKTGGWGTQVPNNVPLAVQISSADLIVEFN